MKDKNFIRSTDHPRWPMHNAEMKKVLGISGKLPKEGVPVQIVQRWAVYVSPLVGEAPARGKRHEHRIIAVCPNCKQHLSAGRTQQHVCRGE